MIGAIHLPELSNSPALASTCTSKPEEKLPDHQNEIFWTKQKKKSMSIKEIHQH